MESKDPLGRIGWCRAGMCLMAADASARFEEIIEVLLIGPLHQRRGRVAQKGESEIPDLPSAQHHSFDLPGASVRFIAIHYYGAETNIARGRLESGRHVVEEAGDNQFF